MLSLIQQRKLGFPTTRHDLESMIIRGNVKEGFKKTTLTSTKITAFTVKGTFLALLDRHELQLWDHTKNVVLWTKVINPVGRVRYDETLKFIGESLLYGYSNRFAKDFVLVLSLSGTQTRLLSLPGPIVLTNDRILHQKDNTAIGSLDLEGEEKNEWGVDPGCTLVVSNLFETDKFACVISRNNLSITNKITREVKSLQLDQDWGTFTYRPLFDNCFVFYKLHTQQGDPSPSLIVDLELAEVIQSDVFSESGPISDLIHHEGWIYVAGKDGSLIAYHLNGNIITLQEKKRGYLFITKLSVDGDFLLSHSSQRENQATITIWNTLTNTLIGSFNSAEGLALLINDKIFSNTDKGFDIFDLFSEPQKAPVTQTMQNQCEEA